MSNESPGAGSAPAVQWGPMASYFGVVKSLPFEARFEEIQVMRDLRGVRTEERATGTVYRDSAGRVRRELHLQRKNEEDFELTTIADLAARTVVALDIAAKAATRFTDMGPPPGKEIPLQGWGFSGAWSVQSAREERMIEGVACKKAQHIAPPLLPRVESRENPRICTRAGPGARWLSLHPSRRRKA